MKTIVTIAAFFAALFLGNTAFAADKCTYVPGADPAGHIPPGKLSDGRVGVYQMLPASTKLLSDSGSHPGTLKDVGCLKDKADAVVYPDAQGRYTQGYLLGCGNLFSLASGYMEIIAYPTLQPPPAVEEERLEIQAITGREFRRQQYIEFMNAAHAEDSSQTWWLMATSLLDYDGGGRLEVYSNGSPSWYPNPACDGVPERSVKDLDSLLDGSSEEYTLIEWAADRWAGIQPCPVNSPTDTGELSSDEVTNVNLVWDGHFGEDGQPECRKPTSFEEATTAIWMEKRPNFSNRRQLDRFKVYAAHKQISITSKMVVRDPQNKSAIRSPATVYTFPSLCSKRDKSRRLELDSKYDRAMTGLRMTAQGRLYFGSMPGIKAAEIPDTGTYGGNVRLGLTWGTPTLAFSFAGRVGGERLPMDCGVSGGATAGLDLGVEINRSKEHSFRVSGFTDAVIGTSGAPRAYIGGAEMSVGFHSRRYQAHQPNSAGFHLFAQASALRGWQDSDNDGTPEDLQFLRVVAGVGYGW